MTPNIYTRHILIIFVLKLYSFYYKIICIYFQSKFVLYISTNCTYVHTCMFWLFGSIILLYIAFRKETGVRDFYLHSCTCFKINRNRDHTHAIKHYLVSSNTFFNCPDSCILISSFSPPMYFVPINNCGTCEKIRNMHTSKHKISRGMFV